MLYYGMLWYDEWNSMRLNSMRFQCYAKRFQWYDIRFNAMLWCML